MTSVECLITAKRNPGIRFMFQISAERTGKGDNLPVSRTNFVLHDQTKMHRGPQSVDSPDLNTSLLLSLSMLGSSLTQRCAHILFDIKPILNAHSEGSLFFILIYFVAAVQPKNHYIHTYLLYLYILLIFRAFTV